MYRSHAVLDSGLTQALYSTELWRSWGVKPDTVLGEGVGEYAAACAAGILTIEDALRLAADFNAPVTCSPAQLPLVAGLTGSLLDAGQTLDADYWRRQIHEPGRFAEAIDTIGRLGSTVLVEPGSESVPEQLAEGLARLYVAGVTPDWREWDRPWTRRKLALPTYAFQRRRYWVERAPASLLGGRQRLASGATVYSTTLNCRTQPFLADHSLYGALIVPGATYAAMALAACGIPCRLANVMFFEPMFVQRERGRSVQLLLSPQADGSRQFEVFSAPEGQSDSAWTLHCRGVLQSLAPSARCDEQIDSLRDHLGPFSPDAAYARFALWGLDLGPSFRVIRQLWVGDDESLAEMRIPAPLTHFRAEGPIHPAVLDACTSVVGGALCHWPEEIDFFVPLQYERVELFDAVPEQFFCHAKLLDHPTPDTETIRADLTLLDNEGRLLGQLKGFVSRRAERRVLLRTLQPQIDDWFYDLVWREQPPLNLAEKADFLRASVLAAGNASTNGLSTEQLGEMLGQMEVLSQSYALQALSRLGWHPQAGEAVDAEALADRLGVADQHRRLWRRLFALLADAGISRSNGAGWIVARPISASDPAKLQAELLQRYPLVRLELTLLGRCGDRLAEVLTGEVEPVGLLFPPGDGGAGELYHEAPLAGLLNGVVADVLAKAAAALPAGRRLRVLEVGAGTGGTTASILPLLPPDRTDYLYTDLSAGFLPAARKRFSSHAFVRYQSLNVERDALSQGVPAESFDVIIAAQVLHAVRDLPAALRQLRRLLAPGGLLVLVEGLRPRGWLDLTFGLLPGWWQFADDWRKDYPLLTGARWQRLLAAEGFEGAMAVSPAGMEGEQAVLLANAAQRAPEGVWLVFGDAGGLGSKLAERLKQQGRRCLCIETDESLPPGEVCAGVICLWALDAACVDAGIDAALTQSCARALHLVQALARSGRRPGKGLWFVTRAAQPVGGDETLALMQSPLWGLGRVVAQEHPELKCRLLDLDPIPADGEADQLLAEILSDDIENQRALRGGKRHALRLVHAKPSLESQRRPQTREGTYLITGGLGGLGLEVARWLVQSGVRQLALLGRHAPSERAESIVARLREQGCTMQILQCDVSNCEDLAQALRKIEDSLPPLRGVIHAAGVLDDGALINQSWDRFQTVFAAKVHGAWNLDRLTAGQPLECFVLFSSMTSLLGPAGQGNHAAANAFLDALAHDRRRRGQPGITINWGAWSDVGAAARDDVRERMQEQGVSLIAPEQGLTALDRILGSNKPQALVWPVSWPVFARRVPSHAQQPFMAELREADTVRYAETPAPAPVEQSSLLPLLENAGSGQRRALATAFVQQIAARSMGLDVSAVDPSQDLKQYGLDSLMAVSMRNSLSAAVGRELPVTLLFDYPSPQAVADFILNDVLKQGERRHRETSEPEQTPSVRTDLDALSTEELASLLDAELDNSAGALH